MILTDSIDSKTVSAFVGNLKEQIVETLTDKIRNAQTQVRLHIKG